jgi:hypothetical protein
LAEISEVCPEHVIGGDVLVEAEINSRAGVS